MSSDASVDRESFQTLLANAFAVQNSGLDPRSLSALIEMQHFLTTDEFTVDQALCLVADRALNVSNASGIAIALLEGDQLVYRAGAGVAATDVGRHMPAVLGVCTRSKAGVEILRVENAHKDSRIEAEICRQFGATALLILPIYRAQAVAGVLQVHFIEAHKFLDREVRTYRLMVGVVEEAMSRNVQHGPKEVVKESVTMVHPISQNTSQEQGLTGNDDSYPHPAPEPDQSFGEYVTGELKAFAAAAAVLIGRQLDRLPMSRVWRIGAAATAALSITFAIWVGHGRRQVAPAISSSTPSTASDTGERIAPKPLSQKQKSRRSAEEVKDTLAPSSAFRRSWNGPNEVDYAAEDVTVRYFKNRPARQQTRVSDKSDREVNFGDDVTVRYFARKSAPSQIPSASGSMQPTGHASSEPQ